MKNVLILHGAGNNSQGNWFPWLKKELESKGYKVWVPDLPDSEHPNTKKWLEIVKNNQYWAFGIESILIGHSAGATFILRLLEEMPQGIKVHKAILVAGPVEIGTKPEYFQYKQDLVRGGFDWEKIKNSCEYFYFLYSDNDKYQCGEDQGKILQSHLGGELIVKYGEGHFNLEEGEQYKEFSLLLELIK